MDPKIIKKTKDSLGKIITKPPLTEKLLSKPPFRFLHDIITEVIRNTGFLKGLLTAEEKDSKQVTNREAKVAFLQKIIGCVSLVHGSALSVKPSKVVAGQEPEKTNELLQVIARCIRKNMSSDEAVKEILTGKSGNERGQKEVELDKKAKKEKEASSNKKHRDNDEKIEAKSQDDLKDKEKKEERHRRHKEKERSSEHREKSRHREDRERSKHREDRERSKHREDRERSKHREDRERSKHREDREKSKHRKDRERSKHGEEKKQSEEKQNESLKTIEDKSSKTSADREAEKRQREQRREERKKRREKVGDTTEGEKIERKKEEMNETPEIEQTVRNQRPASAKGQRRRPQTRSGRSENEENEPIKAESRKLVRPPSARPSAPRIRRNAPMTADERVESLDQDKSAPIIIDREEKMTLSDDEDAQFVVQEDKTLQDSSLLPAALTSPADEIIDPENHGGLVRKILDTKKEIESSAAKQQQGNKPHSVEIQQQPNVLSAQQLKERQLVVKEIEHLRECVQKLCQSSAPLARLIDYSQEDMDAMQNELNMWKKENKQHDAKIKEDNKITSVSIEPLKAELEDLEQAIVVYRTQMSATKSNIIRNEEKIQKMLTAVATQT